MYKSETSVNGERYYTDSDNNKYISVTSLLGKYEDKTGLTAWQERIGIEQANFIRDSTAVRGTQTHTEIENFLVKKPFDINNDYASAAINGFYSKVTPLKLEEVVFFESIGARVAGRFDQLVHIPENTFKFCNNNQFIPGGNVITDLKTKDKTPRIDKPDYILKHLLQGAAYATVLEDTEQIPVNGIVIVYAIKLKTKNCCKIIYLDKHKIKFYWEHFYAMLLDFFDIKKMKYTWGDIIRDANYTYDFELDGFIDYMPQEIY